jgi:hypothetical protein
MHPYRHVPVDEKFYRKNPKNTRITGEECKQTAAFIVITVNS